MLPRRLSPTKTSATKISTYIERNKSERIINNLASTSIAKQVKFPNALHYIRKTDGVSFAKYLNAEAWLAHCRCLRRMGRSKLCNFRGNLHKRVMCMSVSKLFATMVLLLLAGGTELCSLGMYIFELALNKFVPPTSIWSETPQSSIFTDSVLQLAR